MYHIYSASNVHYDCNCNRRPSFIYVWILNVLIWSFSSASFIYALCVWLGFGWLFHYCIYIGEAMQQFWCSVHCAKNSLPNRNWKQLLLHWLLRGKKWRKSNSILEHQEKKIRKNSERKNTTNNESFEVNVPNAQDC